MPKEHLVTATWVLGLPTVIYYHLLPPAVQADFLLSLFFLSFFLHALLFTFFGGTQEADFRYATETISFDKILPPLTGNYFL